MRYIYDDTGRMIEQHTFRSGAGWGDDQWPEGMEGPPDITTFQYDPGTGLLVAKTDALGHAVTYTYTVAGDLATRTWARTIAGNPLVTTYTYDPATGDLTGIIYSDTTPDITYTRDRLGNPETITDAMGTRTLTRNSSLQPETETITGLYNRQITRIYETDNLFGRPNGFQVDTGYRIQYDHDNLGHLNQVAWTTPGDTGAVTYTWCDQSPLLCGLTSDNGLSVTYTYADHRDLKIAVDNRFNDTLISRYAYTYNANGQRTSVSRTGKAFQDALIAKIKQPGWVEKHLEQTADGPVLRSDHRAYAYDPIGNRTSSEDWNRATGENRITTYESNPLNQYDEQITGNGVTGTFEHDEDGNLVLTSMEGRDTVYTYDGENRLSTVEPAALWPGSQKVAFLYDYMGRRVQKAVYSSGYGEWQLEKEVLFVYDGWNLIEEITVENSTETSRYFVWGLDLSQSLQGAGGVGGLLAVADGGNAYQYYFDGNGNVGQLVDAANGGIAAHYEFDPFGNIIYSSGSYAGDNPFIFSTKYQDAALNPDF